MCTTDNPVPPQFSPDGLDEQTIDSLIDEAYAEVSDDPSRPSWLSSDSAKRRRIRRRARQAVRQLPGYLAAGHTSRAGEVDR